ncbi:hypothetical protein ACE1SV_33220 [Streptomyces sp. E-15]
MPSRASDVRLVPVGYPLVTTPGLREVTDVTPRLRITLRRLRPLAVLTAVALPVYGIAVVYGSPPAHTAEPAPARSLAPGHGAERPAPTPHPAREQSSPGHTSPGHGDPGRGQPESGRGDPGRGERGHEDSEQRHPGHDRPDRDPSAPAGVAPEDTPDPVPMPSDSASASVHPYRSLAWTEPSRAGSRAGEGRMRPGRPDGPAAQVEGDDDPAPATPAAQPAEPETTDVPAASESPDETGTGRATTEPPASAQQAQEGEAPAEPVLRLLPLGSGLVLIGLGLGLALLGLRLRRS